MRLSYDETYGFRLSVSDKGCYIYTRVQAVEAVRAGYVLDALDENTADVVDAHVADRACGSNLTVSEEYGSLADSGNRRGRGFLHVELAPLLVGKEQFVSVGVDNQLDGFQVADAVEHIVVEHRNFSACK